MTRVSGLPPLLLPSMDPSSAAGVAAGVDGFADAAVAAAAIVHFVDVLATAPAADSDSATADCYTSPFRSRHDAERKSGSSDPGVYTTLNQIYEGRTLPPPPPPHLYRIRGTTS